MPNNSIIDMYFDYCRGMSQLEMERKYCREYRSITRKCKQMTVRIYNNSESFVSKNIEQIKRDVESSICHVNRCHACGHEIDFFGGDNEDKSV
jgi:hypothetical protein